MVADAEQKTRTLGRDRHLIHFVNGCNMNSVVGNKCSVALLFIFMDCSFFLFNAQVKLLVVQITQWSCRWEN